MSEIKVAYYSELDDQAQWEEMMRALLPELRVYPLTQRGGDEQMDFAVVWNPPSGALAGLPGLRAIFNMGAGVDALMGDATLPKGVPIIRLVDERLTQRMKEYAVLHVLRYHRLAPLYEDMQKKKQWRAVQTPVAQERVVGVLGLGAIGAACAEALHTLGFRVLGWSRTAKQLPNMSCYSGMAQLPEFIRQVDIALFVLPLTPHTDGLLNYELIGQMKRGVCLINIGRGRVQREGDILQGLADGTIGGVTLDVFEHEPLAEDSPLWDHPAVTITPHVASITDPHSAAHHIVDGMREIMAGRAPNYLVDRERGY
jgi:glyoxylate/hydroxypyruvate reductase A